MHFFVSFLPRPYFPPLLFCPDEWCLCLLHCAFFFSYAFVFAVWLFCICGHSVFLHSGKDQLEIIACNWNKKCCWKLWWAYSCFSSDFFIAHLEMPWSMWIAFVPLLNCTIFVAIFSFCVQPLNNSCLKSVCLIIEWTDEMYNIYQYSSLLYTTFFTLCHRFF